MTRRATPLSWVLFLVIPTAGLFGSASIASGLWSGFYTPRVQPHPGAERPAIVNNACISEIKKAQTRYGIPDNLLLAIGLQEAGRKVAGRLTVWPWTVNSDGEGRFFSSRKTALGWAQKRRLAGAKSIDLGCMQINQRWHGQAFRGYSDAFSPARNVDYAARFLVSLHDVTGNWIAAAGRYHSRTKALQTAYIQRLKVNQDYVRKNLSVLVASTGAKLKPIAPSPTTMPPVFWSAALSQDNNSKTAYGLYSVQAIQPFLPNFDLGG